MANNGQATRLAAWESNAKILSGKGDTVMSSTMKGQPVAIIGAAIRVADARNIDEFWKNLVEGRESIKHISRDELLENGVPESLIDQENYVAKASVVDDIACFDHSFFGYSPLEAKLMDPQQRIFLECCWEAIESAGLNPKDLKERVGVFAGSSLSTYALNLFSNRKLMSEVGDLRIRHSIGNDYLATKVSYKLDLKGPSINLQTACSTSLVAVHQACQSILSGETDSCLAGGISLHAQQNTGYLFERGGIVSSDGTCRPFDEESEGTIFGNGVGVIFLKDYEKAIQDNDPILTVILGSAVNNDGANKAGYTAPNSIMQSAVIEEALEISEVESNEIEFIETHGTATKIGDKLEVDALTEVFGKSDSQQKKCILGSVKSNIGHLNTSAGIVSLIKAALAVKKGIIPPTVHFRSANRSLKLEETRFRINSSAEEWSSQDRYGAVSSFGIGGTNAHVILKNPENYSAVTLESPCLIPLSAKTSDALSKMVQNLYLALKSTDETLGSIAKTLIFGREVFEHRLALVCSSRNELIALLEKGMASADGFASLTNVVQDLPEDCDILKIQKLYSEVTSKTSKSGYLDFLMVLATYWQNGCEIDVKEYSGDIRSNRAARLPSYPFAKGRHWVDLENHNTKAPRELVFLFSGQGTQFSNMARYAYRTFPYFRALFEEGSRILCRKSGLDIRDYVVFDDGSPKAYELTDTIIAQTALFILEVSWAKFLINLGLKPDYMVGHSLGEISAACVGDVIDFEQGIHLVLARAQLMQSMPRGKMISVLAPLEKLRPYLTEDLQIAAYNAPENIVISGSEAAVSILSDSLEKSRIAHIHLRTSHAFHSRSMNKAADQLEKTVETIDFKDSKIPVLTNRFAKPAEPNMFTGQYWASHIKESVNFSQSIVNLSGLTSNPLFIEAGPGGSLLQLVSKNMPNVEKRDLVKSLGGASDISGRSIVEDMIEKLTQAGFQKVANKLKDQSSKKLPDKNPTIQDWFYQEAWVKELAYDTTKQAQKNILVFEDSNCSLTSRLLADSSSGMKFESYHLEFGQNSRNDGPRITEFREIYLSKLNSLCSKGEPHQIIYQCDQSENSSRDFEYRKIVGFLQALASCVMRSRVTISVVGKGLFDAENPAVHDLSTILGPILNMSRENSTHIVRYIDLSNAATDQEIAILCHEIQSEPKDIFVKIRDQFRLVQDFRPQSLTEREKPLFKRRGHYLLIGGQGAVGRIISDYLIDKHCANVSLTTRKSQIFAHDGDGVNLVTMDLSSEDSISLALAEAEKHFGKIDGIIHCAGCTDKSSISRMVSEITEDSISPHFTPKVLGSKNLWAVIGDKDLDFCMAISSMATFFGGIGYSTYAASNIFEDRFFKSRPKSKCQWITTNWEGWPRDTEQRPLSRDYTMSREESYKALAMIDKYEVGSQVVVATADPYKRADVWMRYSPQKVVEQSNSADDISTALERIWKKALGVETISYDDDYFDLGGDSLLAINLIPEISKYFAVSLPVSALMQASTISKMADYIAAQGIGTATISAEQPEGMIEIKRGVVSKPPLFLIHPAGGSVYFYRDLSKHLTGDHAVFAIQSRGLDGKQEPLGSVEEMANIYLDMIKKVQPKGPYYLGGSSFGGVVAFELGRLFKSLGDDVDLLFMLDTPGPGQRSRKLETEDEVIKYLACSEFEDIEIDTDIMAKMTFSEKMQYCRRQASSARGKRNVEDISGDEDILKLDDHVAQRTISMFMTNVDAHWKYEPNHYSGRIVFFRAETRRDGHDPKYPERPWMERSDGMDFYVVPGDHITMNYNPNVAAIGRILNGY